MKTPIWILSLVIILSIIPFAFADIPFDKIATQEIRIYVENDSTAHVEHEIEEFTGSAKVEFLDGHSNLVVPCLLSCPYELDNAEQNFEKSEYMVLKQYPQLQTDYTMKYDLENIMELNNGLWSWDFSANYNPGFYFNEGIDIIFVNSTPIDISEAPGIKCLGSGGSSCSMLLEFFDSDDTSSSTFYEPYLVIQTNDKISDLEILENEYGVNMLKFDINKKGQYVLIDVPTKAIIGEIGVFIFDGDGQPLSTDRERLFTFEKDATTKLVFSAGNTGSVWITGLDMELPESVEKGGGCLIATAAYGSEMAPQVQFLREIRDNTVLQTQSGTSFMTAFNTFYYTFSPTVADYERENPVFKEVVKVGLTPLLTSLTILNYVDIDTEQEMLGYGIGIIMLNIGMYFVAPAVVIIALKNRRK